MDLINIVPSNRFYSQSLVLAITAFVCLMLTACGGESQTRVRVVNAVIDSAAIETNLDNRSIGSLGYRQVSSDYALTAGNLALKLFQTNNTNAFFTNSTSYDQGKRYTQVALGKLIAGVPTNTSLLSIIDSNNNPVSGNFKLRFAHAAPDLGSLDVYVTADGKDFNTDTFRYSLSFNSIAPTNGSNAMEVPAGKYRLRLTRSGTKIVVFDSGAFSEVTGADLQYVIIPSDNPTGASAATVLNIPSIGTAKELVDTRAGFRFANFGTSTAYSGNYDVYWHDINEALSPVNKVLSNTQAGATSTRVDIQAGTKRLTLTQPGSTAEVLRFDIALVAGKRQSAYLIGNATATSGVQALKLTLTTDESASTQVGQSKVRLLNLDPVNTATLDLVTLAVSNIDGSNFISSRIASKVSYLGSATSTYQTIPAGSYQIATVATTLTSPLLPTATGVAVMFGAQRSYSIVQTAAPTRLIVLSDD
jgi:hypothetical protein